MKTAVLAFFYPFWSLMSNYQILNNSGFVNNSIKAFAQADNLVDFAVYTRFIPVNKFPGGYYVGAQKDTIQR